MPQMAPVMTIDGPSGAGKGTLCQLLAEKLGWHLLDSGAIYRVLALAAFIAWALYNPSWNKAAAWGFDRPHMAAQTLFDFLGIAVGLAASWLWRVSLRLRARRQKAAHH